MDDILAPRFIDPVAARKHLEALRWPDGAECPHCGLIKATAVKGGRDGLYQCNACREQFTVTVGTVFEKSKIPLNKWLLATHLLCASKKGMSAAQIQRMLGVTYKTAWFMMHRIREAMTVEPNGPLGGPDKIVEADETFVGGKAKNRAFRKPAPKKMVVALIERGGEARSFHVANVTGTTIRGALVANVDRASKLMTDNAHTYWAVGREFATHGSTIHSLREYAKGDVHSNTAENFFSIFKRGVIGTYHHLSEAHLGRYCAEFDFRYNTRTMTDRERADVALKGIEGKRLTYRRTDKLAA
nr:IS1595 family transposase [uncultured Sphingomonas sp.]